MAFASIPRDLSAVKTKVALNLTRRQLICFGAAAVIGVPAYIFTCGAIGNTGAALLMICFMLPPFFLAMYQKNGQPAETVLRNYIRTRYFWPGTRPYRTENFYEILEKEGKIIAEESKTAAKAAVRKRPSSQRKPSGRKNSRPKRK